MANKQTEFENNNSSFPADDNWLNMVNTELKNVCIGTGQTIDASEDQTIKGMAIIASQASLYCVDTGIANAYVLNPVSPLQAPPVIRTGMSIKFATGNANTGSTNINAYGFGNILAKNEDGTNLSAGDIPANVMVEMYYNGTNWILIKPATKATTTAQGIVYLNNPVSFTFNGSTALDFTAGNVNYNNGSGQLLCSAITNKTLQSSGLWSAGSSANGLDTEARANSTYYHIFEIVNNTTGANDILYSISRTAPTIPSGYTLVAWIGTIRTNASGNIDTSYFALRTIFGQITRLSTGAYATGTTTIPEDNTIPQITEGDEYMSIPIIPLRATSRLEINANIFLSNSAANPRIVALFQDSTANALASGSHYDNTFSAMTPILLNHFLISGTTSSTTFRIRAGGGVAGTTYFNGLNTGQLFNGTMSSSITIKEFF